MPDTFRTRGEATPDVFYCIKGFYNRRRLRSALDYLSPEAHEQRYHRQQTLRLMPCPQKWGKVNHEEEMQWKRTNAMCNFI
jgi:hypothetical protein